MKTDMANVGVLGVGWADELAGGGVRRSVRSPGLAALRAAGGRGGPFAYPVRNFPRFDAVSRLTCMACALALQDAELGYAEGVKMDVGLLGTNAAGALEANRSYFTDYVQAGRKLGRGSLFIYTLPSSPLAEAAIHFGLQGPVLYIGSSGEATAAILRTAADMVGSGEAGGMLAVRAGAGDAICFALGRAETPGRRAWAPEAIARLAAADGKAGDLAAAIARGADGGAVT